MGGRCGDGGAADVLLRRRRRCILVLEQAAELVSSTEQAGAHRGWAGADDVCYLGIIEVFDVAKMHHDPKLLRQRFKCLPERLVFQL